MTPLKYCVLFCYTKFFYIYFYYFLVQKGDYISAVLDRNEAENITRVLYPNDNVSVLIIS